MRRFNIGYLVLFGLFLTAELMVDTANALPLMPNQNGKLFFIDQNDFIKYGKNELPGTTTITMSVSGSKFPSKVKMGLQLSKGISAPQGGPTYSCFASFSGSSPGYVSPGKGYHSVEVNLSPIPKAKGLAYPGMPWDSLFQATLNMNKDAQKIFSPSFFFGLLANTPNKGWDHQAMTHKPGIMRKKGKEITINAAPLAKLDYLYQTGKVEMTIQCFAFDSSLPNGAAAVPASNYNLIDQCADKTLSQVVTVVP